MADHGHTGYWGEVWQNLRRRPQFAVAALLVVVIVLVALFPGLFTGIDPQYANPAESLLGPSTRHWFGTDLQGHDVYARTIYGARASVAVGVGAALAVLLAGGTLGAVAGYFGGWVDGVIARIMDIFFGIPLLLAAIVLMQVVHHRNVWTVIAILAVFGWTQVARITRAAVIEVRGADYVLAAEAMGAGRLAILTRHVLPNAAGAVIVVITIALGVFIVTEATMSYLGVGLPSSMVSWGGDINTAQSRLRAGSLVLFYPAGALAVTVLAFMLLGDALRDALDGRRR
jgi:oligopeptide transport system permease protein